MSCQLVKYKIDYFDQVFVLQILEVNQSNMELALESLKNSGKLKEGRVKELAYIMSNINTGELENEVTVDTALINPCRINVIDNTFNCLKPGEYFFKTGSKSLKNQHLGIINFFKLLKNELDKIQNT